MSEQDRDKWNLRYAAGAYAGRTCPSELLQRAVAENRPERGRALDLACGAGRNARYLADLGFQVDAVDISIEALRRGQRSVARDDLQINWLERDLTQGLDVSGRYQLIVMIHYVNLPLLARLPEYLADGGLLVVEQHLRTDADVTGPRNPQFRVAPGVLAAAANPLDALLLEEGLGEDRDGQPMAFARLIARRSCP